MKHGTVTSKRIVEAGHLEITLQSDRAGVTYENMPVAHTQPGSIQNIEEGWHVLVEQCDDGLWVVMGVLEADGADIPNSLEGREQSMIFDNGTEISARLNSDGDYDVTIKASGDVTLGESDNAVSLAVQNHTHDESGGGTTSTPNEPGTETTAE